MKSYALSYILTTYNKLAYLKVAVPLAAAALKSDEELIVIDGGSTDGGAEYLRGLYDQGQITQFVSEPDRGEGHGFNKAMLMARGDVIKLLTDDDVFHFDAIGHCRDYLLANPQVDFLNTHGGWCEQDTDNDIYMFTEYSLNLMHKWLIDRKAFAFCMLGAMLNRKSLPLLGLFNPSIKRADAEYSLRITSQKMKLAWYTGAAYVRILNQQSNSLMFSDRIKAETAKLDSFYDIRMDGEPAAEPTSVPRPLSLGKRIKGLFKPPVANSLAAATASANGHANDLSAASGGLAMKTRSLSIDEAFAKSQRWMNERFAPHQHEFICS